MIHVVIGLVNTTENFTAEVRTTNSIKNQDKCINRWVAVDSNAEVPSAWVLCMHIILVSVL